MAPRALLACSLLNEPVQFLHMLRSRPIRVSCKYYGCALRQNPLSALEALLPAQIATKICL